METLLRHLSDGTLSMSGQGPASVLTTAELCALSVRQIAEHPRGAQRAWLHCNAPATRAAFLEHMRSKDPFRARELETYAGRRGLSVEERPAAEPERAPVSSPAAQREYRTCVTRPTGGRLLSGFGERESREAPNVMVMHGGVDYGGAIGAPVYAAADGIVDHATVNGARGFARYGRVVVLKHPQFATRGETVRTLYAHLNSLTVNPRTYVRAGEQIGTLGNTNGSERNPDTTFVGNAHLHFEVALGRYPRPRVSATGDPRSARIDPELWLASFPECTSEREPAGSVSSHERSRQNGGFPLWGIFVIGLVVVAMMKGD